MGSITADIQTATPRQVLETARDEACTLYIKNHALSKKNHDEACMYMPGGNTRTVLHVSPFPLTIESAESCHVSTIDGNKYVDFLGEYTAGIYGHNNPIIRKAIEEALDGGWNYGGHSRMEQQLAKIVCERFPAIEQVRFVNSGTEANTMALGTALAWTQKKKVLIFAGGYHGGTISGKVYGKKRNINLPHEFLVAKYNDVEGTRTLVQSIESNTLAAILVEPMMGSGGCFDAAPEFLHSLRELATQQNALLIFDEVMTSRLSYHGYGNHHGVTPDLMTLGKWIGGGMTFGAFGGRKDVMSMYDPRAGDLIHAGTFNNNVFTMSAGVAGCQLLNEDRLRSLNELGNAMRIALSEIFQRYQIKGDTPNAPLEDADHLADSPCRPPKMFVKGVGSLMNIHFGGPERELLQTLYYHHLLVNGLYTAQRGFVALSLEIKQDHIEKFLEITDKFCQQWESALRW